MSKLHRQQSAYLLDPKKQIFQQQKPPLPTTAVEYWHGELGASAANAVGQIASTTLPGINTPSVAADGPFFNGRKVYQAATTGNKSWGATGLSVLCAAGTRPYFFGIARIRAVITASSPVPTFYSVGAQGGAGAEGFRSAARSNGSGTNYWEGFRRSNGGNVNADSGSVQDAVVRTFELVSDATAGLTHVVSGVQVGANNSATAQSVLSFNVTAAYIGGSSLGSATTGDTSTAFFLICSAKPSAAEIANLRAWAFYYWGAI